MMMKKRRWRKAAACAVVMTLMLLTAGCGGNAGGQKAESEDFIFDGSELELPDVNGDIGSYAVSGSRVYFDTIRWGGDAESKDSLTMYSMDLEDFNVKEFVIPEVDTGDEMLCMTCDLEGNLLFMVYTDAYEVTNHSRFIMKFNSEGELIAKEDVTSKLDMVNQEDIVKLVAVSQSSLAVIAKQQVLILDGEYKVDDIIVSENGKIESAARTRDGDIVCGISGDNEAQVQILDTAKKKWSKLISLNMESFENTDALMDGIDYDFYYRDERGICGYDIKETGDIPILSFVSVNVDTDMEFEIIPIEGDRLLGGVWGENGRRFVLYERK